MRTPRTVERDVVKDARRVYTEFEWALRVYAPALSNTSNDPLDPVGACLQSATT